MMCLVLLTCAALTVLFKLYLKLSCGWCKSYTCLVGKTAVITGANSGIGYITALDLAKRGCRVILACRNLERANKAREKIIKATNNTNIVVILIDMDSLKSVKKFAEQFCSQEERLDILVNNAGGAAFGNVLTEDGFDRTTQINHLGPVLLTHLLLDKLKASAPSRIINVSSQAAIMSSMTINDFNKYPNYPLGYSAFVAYYNTKLCNIIHAVELTKELSGTGVTINALHPGGVKTEIVEKVGIPLRYILQFVSTLFYKTAEEGAQTTIDLCVNADLKNTSGCLFEDCHQVELYNSAKNAALSKEVWNKTKTLLQI